MARPGDQAGPAHRGAVAESPVSLAVQVRGELASEDVEILQLSALRGLFSAVVDEQVTFVNAPALAAERGVTAELTTATESPNHRSVVDVRAVYADGRSHVAGTLSGPQLVQKIVEINGRNFDLRAEGVNLVINYTTSLARSARSARCSAVRRSTSRPRSSARTPRGGRHRHAAPGSGCARGCPGRHRVGGRRHDPESG